MLVKASFPAAKPTAVALDGRSFTHCRNWASSTRVSACMFSPISYPEWRAACSSLAASNADRMEWYVDGAVSDQCDDTLSRQADFLQVHASSGLVMQAHDAGTGLNMQRDDCNMTPAQSPQTTFAPKHSVLQNLMSWHVHADSIRHLKSTRAGVTEV